MKKVHHLVLVSAIVGLVPLSALAQSASVATAKVQAPNVRIAGGEVTVRAKVVELDQAGRTVTLKGPKGNLMTVDVPSEVRNFDQVQVGDTLMIRYTAAVAAKLERVTKTGIRERTETSGAAVAGAGAMPGAAAGRTVEILAEIKAIHKKTGMVTLRGAKRTVDVSVPESVDISKLKVGDEVRAVFAEAVVIQVEKAPAK